MRLIIITGLSGAGKSQALRALEDIDFFCVDNLPVVLIGNFAEICKNSIPPTENAALVVDCRDNTFSTTAITALDELKEKGVDCEILFLDCSDEVLLRRYSETRREHPLARDGKLREAIIKERKMLEPIKERATYLIDTSSLKPKELKNMVLKALNKSDSSRLKIFVSSFGYKRGLPMDADIIMDVRFIPNPFYIKELRMQSGLDKEVRDFVFSYDEAADFLDRMNALVHFLAPYFISQGKQRLQISFGCTGGRHRSVAIAEAVAEKLKDISDNITVYHRDLDSEAGDLHERFED